MGGRRSCGVPFEMPLSTIWALTLGKFWRIHRNVMCAVTRLSAMVSLGWRLVCVCGGCNVEVIIAKDLRAHQRPMLCGPAGPSTPDSPASGLQNPPSLTPRPHHGTNQVPRWVLRRMGLMTAGPNRQKTAEDGLGLPLHLFEPDRPPSQARAQGPMGQIFRYKKRPWSNYHCLRTVTAP